MSIEVENVMSKGDHAYGEGIVTVKNTDTGKVSAVTFEYSPNKSENEAIAEAIEKAANSF